MMSGDYTTAEQLINIRGGFIPWIKSLEEQLSQLKREGKDVSDIEEALKEGLYGRANELVKQRKEGFEATDKKRPIPKKPQKLSKPKSSTFAGLSIAEKLVKLDSKLDELKESTRYMKTSDIERMIDNRNFEEANSLIKERNKITDKIEKIEGEVSSLEERESMIDKRPIIDAIKNMDIDKAENLLNELKNKYEVYNESLEEIKSLDDKKTSLAEQLADEKIDLETYKDASESITQKKAEIEEELNNLRQDVIYEDYEKPF